MKAISQMVTDVLRLTKDDPTNKVKQYIRVWKVHNGTMIILRMLVPGKFKRYSELQIEGVTTGAEASAFFLSFLQEMNVLHDKDNWEMVPAHVVNEIISQDESNDDDDYYYYVWTVRSELLRKF